MIVKVSVEVLPAKIGLGEKSFVIPGGCNTVREADALPVELVLVPPLVDEINPLTF